MKADVALQMAASMKEGKTGEFFNLGKFKSNAHPG